jgi:uncharacterized membrane protein YfcA
LENDLIILAIAFFGASVLQAATGVGFGVIAGPVLLMVLNSTTAIQISILQSFLIGAVLVPGLRSQVQPIPLKKFALGSVAGIPLGCLVYLTVEIDILKLLAGLAVLCTLLFVLRSNGRKNGRGQGAGGMAAEAGERLEDGGAASFSGSGLSMGALFMGLISGAMNGSIAMPGPVPAAWMSGVGYSKDAVRATILAMLLFSYPAAFGLQWALSGLTAQTIWLAAGLAPATLAGILVGRLLVRHFTEDSFRWFLVLILLATVAGLFYDSLSSLI